jgi:tetratricopeptide (TPR) repeat protein
MSNYICINSNCIISQSKASFPSEGNCPLCQQALKELSIAPILNHQDEQLIASLPYVIAYPLQDTFQQSDYEKKLHRLAYTFNNFLKYLGLISISEFIHSDFKSRKMIDLFESNIGEPSFGRWNQFIRESYALLSKEKIKLVFPEVYKFYQKANEKKFKIEVEMIDDFGDVNYSEKNGMTAIDMLINFRNKYLGHGTPLSDKQAKALWEYYYPIFKDLLQLMTAQLALHMYKKENNNCWKLQSTEIMETDAAPEIDEARVWLADDKGRKLPLIPFFIIPTLLGDFEKESKLMVYEAYNGQSIKFFSPENIVKETSGEILQRLKLLLREKQKEVPFTPENFGKTQLLERLTEENTWIMETLLREKKIIEGVYQQRQSMEIKLREWIGARANIFFIAAEAGSGKTNLLAEMMNQYKERNISCLFLRAARMQKNTLREELAYRLNIDENHSLEDYTIAGTQAEPTIILLDGLNEAKNSESLWDEMLQLSKQFEPGALKFIIGNRANAKDDLNRYPIADADEQLLYGEKKENEKGLCAYVHWLTPMDMQEMKGAWEHYYQMKKGIYRPNFDFDRIAQFDRGIYNQISNPLVMRLFLELYHGKSLPKKGRHLNIWKDWFHIFSAEEQSFMQNLAALIWEKGANELLFDTVQKSERMKSFFADEKSKIPYQRLLKNGWISRYSKDLDAYIAFTVEGLLLYILGLQLYAQSSKIDLAAVEDLIQSGKKLKKAALDSFLAELAQRDEMELITALIDSGGDKIGICIAPLFIYMKNRGVKALLDKVLENATEHDWKALLALNYLLSEMQLETIRKEFLNLLADKISFEGKATFELGLEIVEDSDNDIAKKVFVSICSSLNEDFKKDYSILKKMADCERKFGNYHKSLDLYKSAEAILHEHSIGNIEDKFIDLYTSLGSFYYAIKDLDNAELYWDKAFDLAYETYGEFGSTVQINSIGVISAARKKFQKALEFYQKHLKINLDKFGMSHSEVALSFHNIGTLYIEIDDLEKAINCLEKSLKIRKVIFGHYHEDIAYVYINLGLVYYAKSDHTKSRLQYDIALEILLKINGEKNLLVASLFKKIGSSYYVTKDYKIAIDYYQKAETLYNELIGFNNYELDAEFYFFLAFCYYSSEQYLLAIDNFKLFLENELTKNKKNKDLIINAYEKIGNSYYELDEYENAIEYFKEYLEQYRLKERNVSPGSYFYEVLGYCNYKLKRYNEAIVSYNKYIEIENSNNRIEPNDPNLYELIGYCHYCLGEYKEALLLFEKALNILLKVHSGNEDSVLIIHHRIAATEMNLKNYDSAIHHYKTCFSLRQHENYLSSIAQCYESLQNNTEAFSYYLQAAEIRKEQLGIEDTKTIEAMDDCRRLSKDLNREGDLPEWMK